MKLLEINPRFIEEHIEELIKIEDYVPISFESYNVLHKRVEFLRSKNLLSSLRDMNEVIRQKCNYHEDPIKAYNSVLIEWLNCHPDFEGIIDKNSVVDYQNMKTNNEFIEFLDLLYDVRIPSESENFPMMRLRAEGVSIKDDTNIKYPNFKKMDKILELYPNCLLGDYLAYLV